MNITRKTKRPLLWGGVQKPVSAGRANSPLRPTVGGAFFCNMKSRFTGKEPWLKIPVEKLTWEDLPKDEAGKSAAICVLVLRSMPYAEYLQTEHWNEVRLVAIKRYLNQCFCGKDAKDVHHTNYNRRGFERPEDVIALCRECHTLWHETWTLQAKAGLEAA